MTDYEAWLQKVRTACEGKSKRSIARWLAARLSISVPTCEVKFHNMLSGAVEPRAPFITAVMAWMENGCPAEPWGAGSGSAGGQARASKLTPERRREIARNARAARTRKQRKQA